jgi:hypothetical protein
METLIEIINKKAAKFEMGNVLISFKNGNPALQKQILEDSINEYKLQIIKEMPNDDREEDEEEDEDIDYKDPSDGFHLGMRDEF